MKNITVIFFVLFLSLQGFSQQTGDTIISNNPAKLKLKVLYFHITNRCHTCYSIETQVRNTIHYYFQTELDSGIIDLSVMNCELKENAKIVEKYSAYGATLAVTAYKDGTEIKTEDLSNFAFAKIHDEEEFRAELRTKIQEYLK